MYGFTHEQVDIWFAKLIQTVYNSSLRATNLMPLNDFLPAYLQRDPTEISLEEQHHKAVAYHARRHELEKR